MMGVLLSDCYLVLMMDVDFDEVVVIEYVVYEFLWSCGNFEDLLCNGYLGVCLWYVMGLFVGYCVLMFVIDEMYLLNLCVVLVV